MTHINQFHLLVWRRKGILSVAFLKIEFTIFVFFQDRSIFCCCCTFLKLSSTETIKTLELKGESWISIFCQITLIFPILTIVFDIFFKTSVNLQVNVQVSADNDVLIFTVACFWPFLQAANAAKLLPKAEAKHPSIKSVNMANSFEKIPGENMALQFAKTACIDLFFWLWTMYRYVDYGTSAKIQHFEHKG